MKKLTKPFSILLSVLMITAVFTALPFTASAAETAEENIGAAESAEETVGKATSGTTGDCTWVFDASTGDLVIGGSGSMADYTPDDPAPWADYADDIRGAVIGDDVTHVGMFSFWDCYYVNKLYLGKSVWRIGAYAFGFCGFREVNIPDNVEVIGSGAFRDNDILRKVTLGKNLRIIQDEAFVTCENLKEITIPESVTKIGKFAFGRKISAFDDVWSKPSNGDEGFVKDFIIYGKEGTAAEEYYRYSLNPIYMTFKMPDTTVEWSFDDYYGTLTISGSGVMEDYNNEKKLPPWAIYRDRIKKVVIGDSIYHIGDRAFYYCSNLTEVVIGERVQTIGEAAFELCGLTELTIPDSVQEIDDAAFWGNYNLAELDLGNGVKYIGSVAFDECALIELTIPDSVERLSGFVGNHSLTRVTIGKNVKLIDSNAFSHCNLSAVTIPDSVTLIGSKAFEGNSRLSRLKLGKKVRDIGSGAFAGCALREVTIPGSVMNIESSAFGYGRVEFYSAGTYHGYDPIAGFTVKGRAKSEAEFYANDNHFAFVDTEVASNIKWSYDSTSKTLTVSGSGEMPEYMNGSDWGSDPPWKDYLDVIQKVVIGDNITVIGSGAFKNCAATSVTIGKRVKEIHEDAFAYGQFSKIVIPESVELIKSAFMDCENLTTVVMGGNVKTLDSYAFNYCPKLKDIDLEGVESIGLHAFRDCDSLSEITIPASLKTLGNCIFEDCDNLTKVTFESDDVEIGNHCFGYKFSHKPKDMPSVYDKLDNGLTFYANKGSQGQYYAAINGFDYVCTGGELVFRPNGAEGFIEPQTIQKGKTSKLPENTYKVPFARYFNGWSVDGVRYNTGDELVVDEDKLIMPIWTEIKKTVYLRSSSTAGNSDRVTVTLGDTYTLPKCPYTSPYKTFSHWTIGEDVYYPGDQITVNDTVVITAQWTDKAVYHIYYDLNGASGHMNSDYLYEGQSYTIRDCTATPPTHKRFGYWLYDGVKLTPGKSVTPNKDLTFTAVWLEEQQFNVSLDFGMITEGVDKVYKGDIYVVPSCTFTPPKGKEFSCWYCSYDNTNYMPGDYIYWVKHNFSLKAVWKDKAPTFDYRDNDDDTLTLYRYNGTDSELYVPTRANGKQVTRFGGGSNYVVYGNDKLFKVVIPNGITSVGARAVENCEWLGNVIISDTVTEIGMSAFSDNPSLSALTLGNSITKIGAYAFDGCPGLKSVTIPASVTEIGSRAFGYYQNPDYDGETGEPLLKTSGFRIIGNKGSAAEEYALENGFTFVDIEERGYNLVLGEVRVNGSNKDDIFGDGRASFDPTTNTLTLNDPVISGSTNDPGLIYAWDINLTVEGSYHMDDAKTTHGIYVEDASLTLDGDFTFIGTEFGALADYDLTVRAGSLRAVGEEYFGVEAYNGSLMIKEDVVRFEAQGGVLGANIVINRNLDIMNPSGGYVAKMNNGLATYYEITEPDGSTKANDVVILNGSAVIEEKENMATGRRIRAIAPLNTELVVEAIDRDEIKAVVGGDYMNAYRISLMRGGVEIKPEESVTVSIPCDDPKMKLFRIEDDNSATPIDAEYKDESLVFETDTMGLYATADCGDVYTLAGSESWLSVGYSPKPDTYRMRRDESGVYSITVRDVPATPAGENYSVKLAKFIDGDKDNIEWIGVNGTDADADFRTSAAGDVTVTYSPASGELTVTGETVITPDYTVSYITAVGGFYSRFLNSIAWNPAAKVNRMTKVSDGVYEIGYTYIEPGLYEFKFAANGTNYMNWGCTSENDGTPVTLGAPCEAAFGGGAFTLSLDELSDVTLRLDLSEMNWTTKTGATVTVSTVRAIPNYLVTFNLNGAGEDRTVVVTEGGTVSAPEDVTGNSSCSFDGWFTDEALTRTYDFSSPVNEDLTLYAKWTSYYCTVTFLSDGRELPPPAQVVARGTTAERPDDPTDPRYFFAGWYTDSTFETPYDFSQAVDEDLTLYAKWSKANLGDTNLDGSITISDVTEIQKHLAELIHFSDEQLALADTNGDGKVDINDATHLQKYLAEFDGIVLGKQ